MFFDIMQTSAVVLGAGCLVLACLIFACVIIKKVKARKIDRLIKILAIALAGLFALRYMWGGNVFDNIVGLQASPFSSKFLTAATLIIYVLGLASLYLLFIAPFLNTKTARLLSVYFVLPVAVLTALFFPFLVQIIVHRNDFGVRVLIYALETAVFLLTAFLFALPQLFEKGKFKLPKAEKKELALIIISAVAMIAFALPSSFLRAFFGSGVQGVFLNLKFGHRMFMYAGIFIPLALYFSLKNRSYEAKKTALLYVAISTLVTFSAGFLAPAFLNPANLPLHLCNTAMYIIVICLIFKLEKLFYFTYFINVLGAFLAMALPNYSDIYLFEPHMLSFWVNHYCAFFMPLLLVALGMYKKPRLRQFGYSMAGFAIYFCIALICNAWFSNYGSVDYFFLNSGFIVDKLGRSFKKLLEIKLAFNIGELSFTFYPLYQFLFFLVYCALGAGMWFIYENGFMFAEKIRTMNRLKNGIRLDELALTSQLGGRPKTEPLYPEDKDMIRIKNFSKQYGRSKVYAVSDVSMDIFAGEIFGFLGPNGAGKSTIIKSLVGIQPLTAGSIEVCGFDIQRQSVEAKMNIGFVPDHYALYERLTGREYINYIADLYKVSKDDRDSRISHYTEIFELTSAFDSQMRTYSHGMKQKIAIIAALIHNPKVWILDEPLTGLDPNSIFQVKETMKEYAKAGNIVFFSSHIMDVVERLCDRFAVIKHGQIIARHAMSEVIDKGATLENYYLNLIESTEVAATATEERTAVSAPAVAED